MADALLSAVCDMDSIVSQNPLTFGLTSAFVTGPRAILQRIVSMRWCQLLGYITYDETMGITTPLLDLDGSTWTRQDLQGLQGQLIKQAKEEDFVTGCSVALTLTDSGAFHVRAVVSMTDGGDYPLEVGLAGAINQLGGTNLSDAQIAANVAALAVVFGA